MENDTIITDKNIFDLALDNWDIKHKETYQFSSLPTEYLANFDLMIIPVNEKFICIGFVNFETGNIDNEYTIKNSYKRLIQEIEKIDCICKLTNIAEHS